MTTARFPVPPELLAHRGLTPDQRAAAIRAAKPAAFQLASAVATRNAQEVQRLYMRLTPEEWAAVAIVLAECVNLIQLGTVKHVPDNGMPDLSWLRGAA